MSSPTRRPPAQYRYTDPVTSPSPPSAKYMLATPTTLSRSSSYQSGLLDTGPLPMSPYPETPKSKPCAQYSTTASSRASSRAVSPDPEHAYDVNAVDRWRYAGEGLGSMRGTPGVDSLPRRGSYRDVDSDDWDARSVSSVGSSKDYTSRRPYESPRYSRPPSVIGTSPSRSLPSLAYTRTQPANYLPAPRKYGELHTVNRGTGLDNLRPYRPTSTLKRSISISSNISNRTTSLQQLHDETIKESDRKIWDLEDFREQFHSRKIARQQAKEDHEAKIAADLENLHHQLDKEFGDVDGKLADLSARMGSDDPWADKIVETFSEMGHLARLSPEYAESETGRRASFGHEGGMHRYRSEGTLSRRASTSSSIASARVEGRRTSYGSRPDISVFADRSSPLYSSPKAMNSPGTEKSEIWHEGELTKRRWESRTSSQATIHVNDRWE
ncbi:hypothetical protein HK097_009247 [Rhizophlyctis rosea]|uniref:Uncharacterized protein n=1 Tax=Rhizophlyctis rosea TaxID=64517 RepID=A0AAD5SLG4_9FUNG|nr:hypothetical protein HK097_009247 [Rhizophlyctis rosea]